MEGPVQTDMILAIKAVHLVHIVSGQKNHEYRKYRLKDGVERLWFYETAEDEGRQAITHIAVIPSNIRHTPGTVSSQPFGIGNDDFNAGRKESTFGYPILELWGLRCPITLREMKAEWGMAGYPMGRHYVKDEMKQAIWGDEATRGERLNRVI